jgi:hypothetical protein
MRLSEWPFIVLFGGIALQSDDCAFSQKDTAKIGTMGRKRAMSM